jgi:hypothetical protein
MFEERKKEDATDGQLEGKVKLPFIKSLFFFLICITLWGGLLLEVDAWMDIEIHGKTECPFFNRITRLENAITDLLTQCSSFP